MSDRNGLSVEELAKRPVTYRAPVQGLADLAELLRGESSDSKRFLRGLALGALVGAAIAGSTIWRRRKGRG
jgi:hypothetical protein